LLRTGNCTPEEAERGLQTVERSARSMSRLVEDVLDVSRIITGKLTLRSDTVDLAAVIDAAVDAVRPAAQTRNIRIGRLTGPHPGPITGDSGRLQQIVWNLLMNAIKFTPENGRVQVELDRVDSCARIVVSDNGEGISPEFLPHLFERFTQADSSSRRSHSGLGLGLAIVQQLVELHGGSVAAQSDGLGKGATIVVKLPLTEAGAATTESTCADNGGFVAHVPSHDLNGITVVFVDDAEDARDFVRKVLTDCGAQVLTASSAAEALAVIESSAPDVILSDIGMPGEDGYDLIRRMRESERVRGVRAVPTAAVTAFARPEDRAKTLDAGFQIHVAKPFNPTQLVATVARLAGRLAASSID
jgi:CheY-like chemotaxis protein/two-component sensor histidine kinase